MADPWPTVEDLYKIHEQVVNDYNLTHTGTRAYFPDDKLAGVIADAKEPDDVYDQAVVFLRKLPQVHVFEDGNKRTAWATVLSFLTAQGIEPPPDDDEAAVVMKHRGRFSDEELATWLRTGEIDRSRFRT